MKISNRKYQFTKAITHQGITFTFSSVYNEDKAYDDIYYNFTSSAQKSDGDHSWTPYEVLKFPKQYRKAGTTLITLNVEKNGQPEQSSVNVQPNTPFQVLTDNEHIYLFRQTTEQTIYIDRFIFDVSSQTLNSTREVRYTRSENKDLPLNSADTFGSQNLNNEDFIEPTTELLFKDKIQDGNFAVVRTQSPGSSKTNHIWHIFSVVTDDKSPDYINVYSIPRSEDGLFNLKKSLPDNISEDNYPTIQKIDQFYIYHNNKPIQMLAFPSAALYAQREETLDQEGKMQLLKRGARVLLTVCFDYSKNDKTAKSVTVVDFTLSKNGSLSKVSDPNGNQLHIEKSSEFGAALSLDGNQSYIQSSKKESIAIDGDLSLECWVTPYSSSKNKNMIFSLGSASKTDSSGSEDVSAMIRFYLNEKDQITLKAGSEQTTYHTKNPIPSDTWNHIAVTLKSGSVPQFYLNGVLQENGAQKSTVTPVPISGNVILGYDPASKDTYTGLISEFRLWKTVRTQQEITAYLNQPITQDLTDLMLYWKMDEGQSSEIQDYSPNENSGMLNGARWIASNSPNETSMFYTKTDSNLLTTMASILSDDIETEDAPQLIDGADGFVHLYYRDYTSKRFFVARYMASVARAQFTVPWATPVPDGSSIEVDNGILKLIAAKPGISMNSATVKVEKDKDKKGKLKITFTSQNATIDPQEEVWKNLPNDLLQITTILNGRATPPGIKQANKPSAKAEGNVIYNYKKHVAVDYKLKQNNTYQSNLFLAIPGDLPDNGLTATLSVGKGQLSNSGCDARWTKDPVPASLFFDLSNAPSGYREGYASTNIKKDLDIEGNIAIEAWINLSDKPEQTIINYGGGSGKNAASFCFGIHKYQLFAIRGGFDFSKKGIIGLSARSDIQVPQKEWTHVAASYSPSYGVHLMQNAYGDFGDNSDLHGGDQITIEAWVQVDKSDKNQTLLSKWDNDDSSSMSWRLGIDKENNVEFKVKDSNNAKSQLTAASISPGDWTHIAAVYDSTKNPKNMFYFNGTDNYIKIGTLTDKIPTSLTIEMWVKTNRSGKMYFLSKIRDSDTIDKVFLIKNGSAPDTDDELLQIEIEGQKFTIPKEEWSLTNDSLRHLAVTVEQKAPWESDSDNKRGLSNICIYQDGILIAHEENFPAAFNLNNEDKLHDWTLGTKNAENDIEDYFKGNMSDVRIWSTVRTQQEIVDHISSDLSGTEAGLIGYWKMNDAPNSGQTQVTNIVDLSMNKIASTSKSFEWKTVNIGFIRTIYVNGQLAGQDNAENSIAASAAHVLLARQTAKDPKNQQNFTGSIDNVRVWKSPRTVGQINYYMNNQITDSSKTDDLISNWAFDEGKGKVVKDMKGDADGKIKGGKYIESKDSIEGLWIPTWFDANWKLFIDGKPVPLRHSSPKKETSYSFGHKSQLTFGGILDDKNKVHARFKGKLNEVRLWSKQLNTEEINNAMYNSLSGDEHKLEGYWPCDVGSGQIVSDLSFTVNDDEETKYNGNDLTISDYSTKNGEIKWAWPNNEKSNLVVPVSEENPNVIDVSNGLETEYSKGQVLTCAPTVTEINGGLGRLYSFTTKDTDITTVVHLEDQYSAGAFDFFYIGQIQSDPTLIGFIEGAPPVPAENLSIDVGSLPDRYVSNASVAISQAENTVNQISTSSDRGFDMSTSAKAYFVNSAENEFSILGAISVSAGKGSFKLGTQLSVEHSQGWLNDASFGISSSQAATNQLDISGGWVNNTYDISNYLSGKSADLLYQQPDRLFYPTNAGFALVRSRTADLFAMRNKRTGATVAYKILPNPDIPEDLNILMFQIDPKYTKNGTLDGRIGFDIDTDWKKKLTKNTADEGSYFKAQEAYAVKRQIEREAKEMQNFFEQYDTKSGKTSSINTDEISDDFNDATVSTNSSQMGREEWKRQSSRRSLVNSYVWTADGGLYSEEEQFTTVRSESEGNSYHFKGQAGIFSSFELQVGVGVLFGGGLEADMLFGGHIDNKMMKTTEEGENFGLSVSVTGEGFLNKQAKPLLAPFMVHPVDFSTLNKGVLDKNVAKKIEDYSIATINNSMVKVLQTGSSWKAVTDIGIFQINLQNQSAKKVQVTQINDGLYPVNYESDALPGKVKGYRFMSYYLASDKDNFEHFFNKVLDSEWLASDDPDAAAMREAQDNTNEVWRVFHRVSFVERVPPSLPESNEKKDQLSPSIIAGDSESVANQIVVHPDKNSRISNEALIQFIKSQVDLDDKKALSSTELSEISKAADAIIKLYGIEDTTMKRQLKLDIINYFSALFATVSPTKNEEKLEDTLE